MLLLVDAGNTNTVFGVARPDEDRIEASVRFSSSRERTAAEWFSLLRVHLTATSAGKEPFSGVVISSVVPPITAHLTELSRRYLAQEPLVIDSRLDLGMRLEVAAPGEVGADRLVNCAYTFAKFGGPAVVIDLGTATKIEVISSGGAFIGGVIAPGLGLSLDALAQRAARLFVVELVRPAQVIGRDTVAAVQSGVVTGHIAMIEGLLTRITAEHGHPRTVVLTGGYSSIVAQEIGGITHTIPDLTLLGLRYLHERNR